MKKQLKSMLVVFTITMLIGLNIFTISNATAVKVTDENLKNALESLTSSKRKISVSNNTITVTSDGKNYTINYDLKDKPTFTSEVLIQQGMNYEEFEDKTDNLLLLPELGYLAVANIQGVKDYTDVEAYIGFKNLVSGQNGKGVISTKYTIIDDTVASDGITVIDNGDENTIIVSKFGERTMQYVNAMYKDPFIASDEKELNSYNWVIERKDVTETSCRLVSTLIVNDEADFSKLNGYIDSIYSGISSNNTTNKNEIDTSSNVIHNVEVNDNNIEANDNNTIVKNQEDSNKNVISSNEQTLKALPQSGEYWGIKELLIFIIIASIISIVSCEIYGKKLKSSKK